MKFKKKLANLIAAQAWYDRQSQNYKNSTTRPGSVKQRTASAS